MSLIVAGLTCLLLAACSGGGPSAPPDGGGGGCGAGSDNSGCGNVGDPYEGNGPPANQQPLSACGTLSSSSTNYKVTQNIGSDPTATCIQIDYGTHHVNLDLGGYTVTGAIFDGGQGNGNTVYHGTVNCNRAVTFPDACVTVYAQGGITSAQWRAHHLTINNSNESGKGVIFEQDSYAAYSGGGSGLGMAYRLDHLSVTSPTGTGVGNRFVSISGYGNYGSWEADHNYVHCTGRMLNGCQGIGVGSGSPDKSYTHNNLILMDVMTDGYQYGRAVIDEPSGQQTAGEFHVYANDITATNNMAIRIWGDHAGALQSGTIYDNIIRDARLAGSSYGAIYLPENDVVEGQENVEIYGNTVELHGGNAFAVDTGYGINVHDNTITCYNNDSGSAGRALRTNEMSYGNNLTAVIIKNTTLPANWGSKDAVLACGPGEPSGYNCLAPTHTTSVTYCNTGTVVGNGTRTQSCPKELGDSKL